MSKSSPRQSLTSVRQTPAADVQTSSGSLTIHAEVITIETLDRVELVDLTERIGAIVLQSKVQEGLASVWSMHTTCAVFINEVQTALHKDIKQFLENTVSRNAAWVHNDPLHSDCDRSNADAHLRAIILGHSLTLQITGGELVLGQWQRVLAAELDGPRSRTIRVQVQGLAAPAR